MRPETQAAPRRTVQSTAMMDMSWLPQTGPEVGIVSAVVGLLLLLLGRRLFWLALGTAGFLTGFLLVSSYMPAGPEALRWVLAVVGGIAGALLAVFVQRLAVAVAGFLLGGYGALLLAQAMSFDPGSWWIVVYALGGLVAALVAALLFESALIAISAILGAAMLVHAWPLPSPVQLWLFLVLLLAGVAIQSRGWHRG